MQTDQTAKTPNPNPQTRNPHSQNARTHGLTATNPAVTRSEKIRFNKLRKALLAELDPQSVTELFAAEQIILHRWFLVQCDAAEAACMRAAVHDFHHPRFTVTDAVNPTAGQLKYKLAQVNTPRSRADRNDHDLRLAYNAPELDKIHRYRKEHQRALDEWKRSTQNRPLSPQGLAPFPPLVSPCQEKVPVPLPSPITTKRNPARRIPTPSQENTYDPPNRAPSRPKSTGPNVKPHKKSSPTARQPLSSPSRSTSACQAPLAPPRAGSSPSPATFAHQVHHSPPQPETRKPLAPSKLAAVHQTSYAGRRKPSHRFVVFRDRP